MEKKNLRRELIKRSNFFFRELNSRSKKEVVGFSPFIIKLDKEFAILNGRDNLNHFPNYKKLVFLPYSDLINIKKAEILVRNIKKEEIRDYFLSKNRAVIDLKLDEIKFLKKFNPKFQIIAKKRDLDYLNQIKVNYKVDNILNDHLKAKEQILTIYELSKKGKAYEESIINLLVLGEFGIKKKELKTRDAITTFDFTISKELEKKIESFDFLEGVHLFIVEIKGNKFMLFLIGKKEKNYTFDKGIKFELLEYFPSRNLYFRDYEDKINKVKERETAGAFFAAKLAIFELLENIKKKSDVLIVRIIKNYEISLGVVLIRESLRKIRNYYRFKDNYFHTLIKKESNKIQEEDIKIKYQKINDKKDILKILTLEKLDWKKSRLLIKEFKQRKISDWF